MKQNKIYGLILAISVLIFSGCGNDTKENPPPPVGPYSFFNPTSVVTITKSGTCDGGTCLENSGTCTTGTCSDNTFDESNSTDTPVSTNISVQLLKHGLAEPGQAVQMLPFDSRYGEVLNTVVETNENGYAIFEYMAPEGSNYDAIRGHDSTITAIFVEPTDNVNVVVNDDAPPVITLTQDFVLQFR